MAAQAVNLVAQAVVQIFVLVAQDSQAEYNNVLVKPVQLGQVLLFLIDVMR